MKRFGKVGDEIVPIRHRIELFARNDGVRTQVIIESGDEPNRVSPAMRYARFTALP